jgi:glycosyltransferase involved in cell wall biosynthesis
MMLAERITCWSASQVIAVSESLRQKALGDSLCEPTKIRVLRRGSGNGVAAATRFNPANVPQHSGLVVRQHLGAPDGMFMVGFVGRITRDKGVRELSQAWHKIASIRQDVGLMLIGPDESDDVETHSAMAALRQLPNVWDLGAKSDMPEIYSAMDLLCLPSYREGFPNVVLEAASMCVPSVTTDAIGCVDSVLDGLTGTIVPVGDAQAIATAILRYADDKGLCECHGYAARARVIEHFQQEPIWEDLLREYHASLARV